ncbi:terminase small subunit [Mucilaginibacter auburnensis]|uniref:DNA-packaging protein gp3 n=1 Tax=Mucilaginibacter auburnensis TaxID=1457233 RepID=A0A2H9VNN4_9SPHI|nr:terminase small subunit [Mucilaginibacter auburnensis]PJJ79955.1 DNA-packaging protein gp3 [Mucilaginibacter auburnensis]
MPKKLFKSVADLCTLVEEYFKSIEGEYSMEEKPQKKSEDSPALQKVTIREPEPATMAGLALHLGFNSRDEFDKMEKAGKYSATLQRARLRVEVGYEKKLHQQSASGALFALKNMGWNDKPDDKQVRSSTTIAIKLIDSGPAPASSEREVAL